MCATLVGNCDIRPCCARRRLSSHPSASAPSTADKLANNLYVQIKLIWKLVAGISINRYSNMAQEKINPSMFGPRRTVVYTVLVASGGSWNSVSEEQIRLQLSSSAWWCLGVSFYCSAAAVTQRGATSVLQFCDAAPREGQFTRVGASIGETRYWKTTVQIVGQHSPRRYICPFISFLLSRGCHSPTQSQVPQRQPLLSPLGCQRLKREERRRGKRTAASSCATILKLQSRQLCLIIALWLQITYAVVLLRRWWIWERRCRKSDKWRD